MIKSTVTVEILLEFLEDYLSHWSRVLLTERVITLPIGLIGVGVIIASVHAGPTRITDILHPPVSEHCLFSSLTIASCAIAETKTSLPALWAGSTRAEQCLRR